LDQVILRVTCGQKATVYDPHRVAAGTLIAAVTWGVFGLLSGGVSGLGVWAILGAVCGGLFAYYREHLLTKDELRRLGRRLPGDSSAFVAFVQGGDGAQILSSVAPSEPAEASVAAIGPDLSARVLAGAAQPQETSSAPAGGGPVPLTNAARLSMLLLRYRGTDTAKRTMVRARARCGGDGQGVQPELVIEARDHGQPKATDPTQLGAARYSKSDMISWGCSAWPTARSSAPWPITEYSALSRPLPSPASPGPRSAWPPERCTGCGRAVPCLAADSAASGPLLPPDTSTVVAWSEANLTDQTVGEWAEPGSERLILRFNPVSGGALLEV
jgi:hypothetical protein